MIRHLTRHCFKNIVVLVLFLQCYEAFAQNAFQPEKFEWYSKKVFQSPMFVHFDKNVYLPGEQVWFASYVLNTKVDNKSFHSISISLIRDTDKKICFQQVYAMQYGISNGNFNIPDTVLPGAYHLVVFGSKLLHEQPECLFVQPITIKASSIADMFILLKNTSQNVADSIKVQVKLLTKAAQPITSQSVAFASVNPSQKLAIKGMIKTNAQGEALIAIPTKKLTQENSLLKVFAKKGFEYTEAFIQLPISTEKKFVQFYPESGHFIAGFLCNLGIEVRDAAGAPLLTPVTLFENNKPIQTGATGLNGLGCIKFTPNEGSTYTVKLADDTSLFALPVVQALGSSLYLKKAVTNDTLDVLIQSTRVNEAMSLVFHNYKEVFGKIDFILKKNTKRLKFPVADIPKGLFTVTLTDSTGKLLCDRLAFAHTNKRVQAKIQTIEKIETRGKVLVKVLITDEQNIPQKGIFSMACVQENRCETRKSTDIESHVYINDRLNNVPYLTNCLDSTQQLILENILLTNKWRKYSWNDLLSANNNDAPQSSNDIRVIASVKNNPADSKPPYQFQLIKDEGFEIIPATKNGECVIEPAVLYTLGKQIFITAKNARNEQIPFTVNNPYPKISEKIAAEYKFPMLDFSLANYKKQPVANIDLKESVKMLEEVVVTTTTRCMRPSQRNECGDYVCKTKMLNCPIHLTCGTPAVNGEKYYTSIAGRIENLVYRCDGINKISGINVQTIKGIALPQKFYEVDLALTARTIRFIKPPCIGIQPSLPMIKVKPKFLFKQAI